MIDHTLLEKTKDIYLHFDDDISKKLFDYRIAFSLSHDEDHLQNLQLELFDDWRLRWISDFIDKAESPEICIFGSGNWGDWAFRLIKKTKYSNNPICYVDNDKGKVGKTLNGCDIYPPEWLKNSNFRGTVLIQNSRFWPEIYTQCCQLVQRNQIYVPHYGKLLGIRGNQYFDVLKPDNKEVFVDVGSYDGGDSISFSRWCCGNYEQIYVLEPNNYQANLCIQNLDKANIMKYIIIKKGAYSETGKVPFSSQGMNMGSIKEDDTNSIIEVDTIDNILNGKRVSFIKMDIEGSEYEALKGAKKTICNYRPKMAICVYHKPEDLWTIPGLLLEYDSTYRFKLRQYQTWYAECVLYAY